MDAELAKDIMSRRFQPSLIGSETWEGYIFSDLEIRIKESTDVYGAVLWPSVHLNILIFRSIYIFFIFNLCRSKINLFLPLQAIVLCHFLETNQDKYNLADKNVIELGAGTGLVTIVSSLLGTPMNCFGAVFFSLP